MASQADTQPSNWINTQSQQVPEADSWAKLVFAFKPNPGCVWIKNEFSRFGKLPDCDIPPTYINQELLKSISKNHFVIQRRYIRSMPVAIIKDISTYGTYINGELIGKGCTRVLGHRDTISAVKSEFKICRFHYLSDVNPTGAPLPLQVKLDYHVMDLFAAGKSSQMFYVLNKKTSLPAAMKFAPNLTSSVHKDDGVCQELKLLRALKHPNIIGYYDHILMNSRLYLFVEYMNGGDLKTLLHKKGRLSEPLTRIITKQIIAALEYLHDFRIAHRNIEPANILLSNEERPQVKIKNLRGCKKLRKGDSSVDVIGETIFDAPETKRPLAPTSRYDLRVDVWSFGVLLYICLCGREPVEGTENNAGGIIHFSPKETWFQISSLAKQVIEKSLIVDPKNRFHSGNIARLPWFIVDPNQQRKRPNILTSSNTPKRFKTLNGF